MNEVDLLMAQNKKFNYIGVTFFDQGITSGSSKTYHYKTLEQFLLGDKAVVYARGNLQIVEVTSVDCILEINDSINYQWAVCKIDFTEHNRCKTVEETLKTQLNSLRIKKLRTKLSEDLADELGVDGVKALARL